MSARLDAENTASTTAERTVVEQAFERGVRIGAAVRLPQFRDLAA
ncbi:MAG TPA: hypothetical protein VML91_12970 [Burkholderiales bacterium]|nr:hypothetical protein [Burkholderiales bacterium]